MSDEETPGSESWKKSTQITRALGLPFTSVFAAFQFIKGWKSGAFTADGLQAIFEIVVYLGLMVYYPIHAAVVWVLKRTAAGKNPNSTAPEIIPPKIVTATINTVKRLTQ